MNLFSEYVQRKACPPNEISVSSVLYWKREISQYTSANGLSHIRFLWACYVSDWNRSWKYWLEFNTAVSDLVISHSHNRFVDNKAFGIPSKLIRLCKNGEQHQQLRVKVLQVKVKIWPLLNIANRCLKKYTQTT